jgi:fructose-1,6-bisphosphatase/inositol monophosphatase family enzyme
LEAIASSAAKEAASVVHRNSENIGASTNIVCQHKNAGDTIASQVVTSVDIACQNVILKRLHDSIKKFDLGLLTEELADDGSRFKKAYFWCIDPLDGTLSFMNNQPGFAISIALISRKGEVCIGVVFDPINNHLYSSVVGEGVKKNEVPWYLRKQSVGKDKNITLSIYQPPISRIEDSLIVCHDRSFMENNNFSEIKKSLEVIADSMNYSSLQIINSGGAVMNAIWCLECLPALYFKQPKLNQGGGCIWDFAATNLIFNELGFIATDYYGEEINFNPKKSVYMNQKGIFYSTETNIFKLSDMLVTPY